MPYKSENLDKTARGAFKLAIKEGRLTAEPAFLGGKTPEITAKDNNNIRYSLTTDSQRTLNDLAKKGILNESSIRKLDETRWTGYINGDAAKDVAELEGVKELPVSLPENYRLANHAKLGVAYIETDEEQSTDILLLRTSPRRRQDAAKASESLQGILENSRLSEKGAAGQLYANAFDEEVDVNGQVTLMHVSKEMMQAIKHCGDNQAKPFGDILNDASDVDLSADEMDNLAVLEPSVLLSLAAKHMPARDKPYIPPQPSSGPQKKEAEPPKPLKDYVAELQEAGIHFQTQRLFNGELRYMMLIPKEHSGLVQTLANPKRSAPAMSLPESGKYVFEGEDYQRYRFDSEQAFNTFRDLFDDGEQRTLDQQAFGLASDLLKTHELHYEKGEYDERKGTYDTHIDQLIVTQDPEHPSRRLLYVVARAPKRPQDSHRMLNQFNTHKNINATDDQIARITRLKGDKHGMPEFPAIERLSISKDVADDILAQRERIKQEQGRDIIADQTSLARKSLADLDTYIRKKHEVKELEPPKQEASKTKPAAGRQSSRIKKDLSQTDVEQQVQAFAAGLATLISSQKERDIHSPLLVRATVRPESNGETIYHELIARVTHKELEMLRAANKLEIDGESYSYIGDKNAQWSEQPIAGSSGQHLVRMRLPADKAFMLLQQELNRLEVRHFGTDETAQQGVVFSDEHRNPFTSVAALEKQANDAFQRRLDDLERDASMQKSVEERGIEAIANQEVVVKVIEHPSEEQYRELEGYLSELKALKGQLDSSIAPLESLSGKAEQAEALAPIVEGLPELLKSIKVKARQIAREIEELKHMIEPWQGVTADQAAFVRRYDAQGRQSSAIVAMEMRHQSDVDAIMSLYEEDQQKNGRLMERKPQLYQNAFGNRDIMVLYPTDELKQELREFEMTRTTKNLIRDRNMPPAEAEAEARNRVNARYQTQGDPVSALKLVEHLRAEKDKAKMDVYGKLKTAVEENASAKRLNRLLTQAINQEPDSRQELMDALKAARDEANPTDKAEKIRTAIAEADKAAYEASLPSMAKALKTTEPALRQAKPLLIMEERGYDTDALQEKLDAEELEKPVKLLPLDTHDVHIKPQAALLLPVRSKDDIRNITKLYNQLYAANALNLQPRYYGAPEPTEAPHQDTGLDVNKTIDHLRGMIQQCDEALKSMRQIDALNQQIEERNKNNPEKEIPLRDYKDIIPNRFLAPLNEAIDDYNQNCCPELEKYRDLDSELITPFDIEKLQGYNNGHYYWTGGVKKQLEALKKHIEDHALNHFSELEMQHRHFHDPDTVFMHTPIKHHENSALLSDQDEPISVDALEELLPATRAEKVKESKAPRYVKLYITDEAYQELRTMKDRNNGELFANSAAQDAISQSKKDTGLNDSSLEKPLSVDQLNEINRKADLFGGHGAKR